MNNSKRIINKNQEILKGFFLSEQFLSDPETFFERMGKAERTAFDRLVAVWKKEGDNFCLSNHRLADLMGCSPATVNRWKARWVEHGLITSELVFSVSYGPKTRQKPNSYSISPYFKSPETISTLGHLLPSLKLLALSLLTVFGLYSSSGFLDKENYNNLYIRRRDIRNLSINNATLAERIVQRSGRMSLQFDDVIPLHVRGITELQLTRAGQMRLSAYPGSAITYARNGIRRTKKFIKSPFAYFVSLCEQYCKENDIRPDWRTLEITKQVFHWKSDDPMIQSSAVNKVVPCKASSDTTHPSEDTVLQGILKREQRIIKPPVYGSNNPVRLSKEHSNLAPIKRLPMAQYKDSQKEKSVASGQNNQPRKITQEISWATIFPNHKKYATKPELTTQALQFLSFCGLKEQL